MPSICVDLDQYNLLLLRVASLQSKWECLKQWEALENRHIQERLPFINCTPECVPTPATIAAMQNTLDTLLQVSSDIDADVLLEQDHIFILDAKLDQCGIPELSPPPAPIVCP